MVLSLRTLLFAPTSSVWGYFPRLLKMTGMQVWMQSREVDNRVGKGFRKFRGFRRLLSMPGQYGRSSGWRRSKAAIRFIRLNGASSEVGLSFAVGICCGASNRDCQDQVDRAEHD